MQIRSSKYGKLKPKKVVKRELAIILMMLVCFGLGYAVAYNNAYVYAIADVQEQMKDNKGTCDIYNNFNETKGVKFDLHSENKINEYEFREITQR